MRESLTSHLLRLLASGPFCLGQVTVSPNFIVTHTDDLTRPDLQLHTDPHDAIDIARLDDAGNYRPLKPAPNLRHGWQLRLATVSDLLLALDFLYPAAIGNAFAHEAGSLPITQFRTTLARQSGMYAIVAKITDEQANTLVGEVCEKGCLRQRLWTFGAGDLNSSELPPGTVPLWCQEACNLLVAAGRTFIKKSA